MAPETQRNSGCTRRGVRALLCVVLALSVCGCADLREQDQAGGVHPPGWADETSPNFHAAWLKANQFDLTRCQKCHGDDFAGGAVGVSCSQNGCHENPDSGAPVPPIACTTCHGSKETPRPDTGAHWAHVPYCDTCHRVPEETVASVMEHASGDESTLVRFGDFATKDPSPTFDLDGGAPSFDPATKRCSNTYCHGALSPVWTGTTQLGCDGCHQAPPANHQKWSRLTTSTQTCQSCHPDALTDTQHQKHVNGTIDVTVTCTTCHGSGGHANPPVDLDGGTDPTTRGVGAHERHLDPSLSDRIANPVLCNDCHVVPQNVTDPGHIDHADTQVRFPFGGSYDAQNATCTVWCHFDKTPGPTWTDNSGGARQCDSCHGFPPVVTRANTPHPSVPGDLSECIKCHVYSKATHVNGVVDFVTP
jgi:predicted CxxxxCH...CXXCH cytochrome family protein